MPCWEDVAPKGRAEAMALANAAIATMREPTEGMCEAVQRSAIGAGYSLSNNNARDVWNAGIDEALK